MQKLTILYLLEIGQAIGIDKMEHVTISEEVEEMYNELVRIRRDLHMHPELQYDLPYTSDYVISYLKPLGLELYTEIGRSGIVAVLKGEQEGKCIMLRADMDALPIEENNEIEYKSKYPGRMHACGHDGHTAMLLVTAKILSKKAYCLAGCVKFVFQPAEESGHGAREMINDICHNPLSCCPCVDEAYALHIAADIPLGDYKLSTGYVTANSDKFTIKVKGKGGHASTPHETIDPVVCASYLILSLQSIISRSVSPVQPSVMSITMFKGGHAKNVIPNECEISGTIRSKNSETREKIQERMSEICSGIGLAHECSIELDHIDGYPAVYNDSTCTDKAQKAMASFSKGKCHVTQSMGGEDFGYFAREKPACYMFLGASLGESSAGNHSPNFNFDERVMLIGVNYYLTLVSDSLIIH